MVISQTPCRISFAGGGTDFEDFYKEYEGFVVSTAINKYQYVIIKPRFDNKITVNYRSVAECVNSVDEITHNFIRECAKEVGLINGFDIITLSDVPTEGSGLGSSSALIVGLLNAMKAFKGEKAEPEWLAKTACKIEIDILKQPIGKQDQYIAAFGGFKAFNFIKDSDPIVIHLDPVDEQKSEMFRQIEDNLLLYYTKTIRNSFDILSEQKANIQKNKDELIALTDLAKHLYDNLITSNDPDIIGVSLNLGWTIKKKLSTNISNTEIENMWRKAMGAGCLGAKISGAGGGGFFLMYCRKESKSQLRKVLSDYIELPFKFEKDGSKIIFNNM